MDKARQWHLTFQYELNKVNVRYMLIQKSCNKLVVLYANRSASAMVVLQDLGEK